MTKRTLTKSGRLMLLHHLRRDGVIADLTLQEIGDALNVNRSTILRDLRELDVVEREYRSLMATQPWLQREFSTAELSQDLGISPATIRAMINDGLITAVKRDEQWRISLSELQRWRDITRTQTGPGT